MAEATVHLPLHFDCFEPPLSLHSRITIQRQSGSVSRKRLVLPDCRCIVMRLCRERGGSKQSKCNGIRMIDMVSEKKMRLIDPFFGHAAAIAATVHLYYCLG
jgi:hypothetical protein